MENLLLRQSIEETNKVIIDVLIVGCGVSIRMWWKIGKKFFELLESVGHGSEAHGQRPNCGNDLVDDHGCGFEKSGEDGVVIIEDGAARCVLFLVLEQHIT